MLQRQHCFIVIFMVCLYCQGFIVENEHILLKNTLLTTLQVQLKSWSFSFDVKPTGTVTGWSNIVHFTKNGNIETYGDRYPGVWFHPDTNRIHICSAINGNRNTCYDGIKDLPSNDYTKIHISQTYQYGAAVYLYTIALNDTVVFSIENKDTRQFDDVKVYASDPWYPQSKATIRRFEFKNLMENVICEHRGYKTISCPQNFYINIVHALYGKLYKTIGDCSTRHDAVKGCIAASSLSRTREKCGELTSNCSLLASNSWFGDPCKNREKYLHLRYECVSGAGRFITSPFLSDNNQHPVTNEDVKIKGCTLELSSQSILNQKQHNSYTVGWIKDGAKMTIGKTFHENNNTYKISGLTIRSSSFTDEGEYQCALYQQNVLVASSSILYLRFDDLVRTKYKLSFNLTTSNTTWTTEDVMKQVNASIRTMIPSNDLRYISRRDGDTLIVNLFVYAQKANEMSKKLLYTSTRQILQFTCMASFHVDVVNFDLCDSETIGEMEFKGAYSYPVADVGEEITRECQYSSRSVDGGSDPSLSSEKSFQRTCKFDEEKGAYWSPVEITDCPAKTKTQALKNLNSNKVCTIASTPTDCISSYDLSEQLVNIVMPTPPGEFVAEDVALIARLFVKIGNGVVATVTINQTKSIMGNVITVAGKVNDLADQRDNKETTQDLQVIPKSLEYIAGVMAELLNVGETVSVGSKNIGFAVGKISTDSGNNVTITSRTNVGGSLECLINSNSYNMSNTFNNNNNNRSNDTANTNRDNDNETTFANKSEEQSRAFMNIPSSIFQNISKISLYVLSYRNDLFFKNNNNNNNNAAGVVLGSSVLSVTVNNIKMENLTTPIGIRFKIQNNFKKEPNRPTCTYWDENTRQWDTRGMKSISTNHSNVFDGYMQCETTHLTNFALIFNVGQTNANPLELQIITWIGCGISLACLTLTVLSFLLFRRLRRKLVPKLLICLSVSLMCLLVTFLAGGVDRTSQTHHKSRATRCQIVAGLLHYFILNSFLWMLVQAFNLYRSFIKVFNSTSTDTRFVCMAFVFCAGIPAIIVALSALITKGEAYGSNNLCIVQGNTFYYAVLLPTAMVLVINITILIFVIRSITRSTTAANKSTQIVNRTKKHLQHSKIVLACSVLLGLTWLFGVFAVGSLTEVFQYLFCIFNSLQGFFIFVFFILTNDDVLKEWRILFGMTVYVSSSNSATKGKSGTLYASRFSRSRRNTDQLNVQVEEQEEDDIENSMGRCLSILRQLFCRCQRTKKAVISNTTSQKIRTTTKTTVKQQQETVTMFEMNKNNNTTKTTTTTTHSKGKTSTTTAAEHEESLKSFESTITVNEMQYVKVSKIYQQEKSTLRTCSLSKKKQSTVQGTQNKAYRRSTELSLVQEETE